MIISKNNCDEPDENILRPSCGRNREVENLGSKRSAF